jgi:tRNA 2-thiouridine synthesizing protein A
VSGPDLRELDCRGQRCPMPVIALARAVAEVEVGSVVRVIADDPAAAVDIPAWCRLRGHEFIGTAEAGETPTYDVRRLA